MTVEGDGEAKRFGFGVARISGRARGQTFIVKDRVEISTSAVRPDGKEEVPHPDHGTEESG